MYYIVIIYIYVLDKYFHSVCVCIFIRIFITILYKCYISNAFAKLWELDKWKHLEQLYSWLRIDPAAPKESIHSGIAIHQAKWSVRPIAKTQGCRYILRKAGDANCILNSSIKLTIFQNRHSSFRHDVVGSFCVQSGDESTRVSQQV